MTSSQIQEQESRGKTFRTATSEREKKARSKEGKDQPRQKGRDSPQNYRPGRLDTTRVSSCSYTQLSVVLGRFRVCWDKSFFLLRDHNLLFMCHCTLTTANHELAQYPDTLVFSRLLVYELAISCRLLCSSQCCRKHHGNSIPVPLRLKLF